MLLDLNMRHFVLTDNKPFHLLSRNFENLEIFLKFRKIFDANFFLEFSSKFQDFLKFSSKFRWKFRNFFEENFAEFFLAKILKFRVFSKFRWIFEEFSRFFRDIFGNTSKKSRIFLEISKKFEISRFFQGKIRRNFPQKISKFSSKFRGKIRKISKFRGKFEEKIFISKFRDIFKIFEISKK